MKFPIFYFFYFLSFLLLWSCSQDAERTVTKPNVIFVITDDQGYGDMACHGNPWIKTPETDKIYEESVRFTNYHAGTTCAPTRSGLMTGKYSNHVNVWHTVKGRHQLRKEEYTMANAFTDNDYKTGLFGKWHLGDNYPYRPNDRGFKEALYHKAGGVGQAPDYWNNDYFGDTYFRNGEPEQFEGYCTDIWFEEALKFIEKNKEEPFFCYISTNAPHSPFRVAEKYRQMYAGNPEITNASFYGMITNIDVNLGILDKKLEEWGLKENTIFIFTTDNGSSAGAQLNGEGFVNKGFNAGMRGKKGSKYEGGHRGALFLRWPSGNLPVGKDLNTVSSYVDLFPTLVDLCNLNIPEDINFDGISLTSYLNENENKDRITFVNTQRVVDLEKWKDCAVITNDWRLIDGEELYDMTDDPGQVNDVASRHPEVVKELRLAYEDWWEKVSEHKDETSYIYVDFSKEHPLVLSSHDLISDGSVTWNQNQLRQLYAAEGYWSLFFTEGGEYEFRLYRWPPEANLALNAVAPPGDIDEAGQLYKKGKAFDVEHVQIKIDGNEQATTTSGNVPFVSFTMPVSSRGHQLETLFTGKDDKQRSAYYVEIVKPF